LSPFEKSGSHAENVSDLVLAAAADAAGRAEARDARAGLEARRRQLKHRVTGALLAVLTPVFVIVTVLNLTGRMPLLFGRPTVSADQRQRHVLADVSFAVEAIDIYRGRLSKLPPSLAAVDIRGGKRWTYEVTASDRYRISLTEEGERVTYDSTQDPAVFFARVRPARPGGSR
jgi:hypothetical protein